MDSSELEWIADVVEKLQVPQTHNERQRLTKILERVAPALIKALDYTGVVGFVSWKDEGGPELKGQSCNGCGQDHWFDKGGPKHTQPGTKRDGTGGGQCRIEHLFQILAEEQANEDK